MTDNYAKIVQNNLDKLYRSSRQDLAGHLPALQEGERFIFEAFGETCVMGPAGISLGEKEYPSVLGILISLYALGARPESCIPRPFRGFKSLPGSMPYGGAFTTHTEQVLVPHVAKIKTGRDKIMASLRGEEAPAEIGGDFSIVVYPLPKIALCYIFYEADEDFPASVTCLYSGNADCFMPVDGLADVGEYTSRKILALIEAE
ncbi:MAG: DUF3786 domain-containing protein [Desulfobacula sp.]|nr:DUF3786 domain-containing protein [Desulfobacula sp.]